MKDSRKTAIMQETGKYLIDISKLVFGGIILAGIMAQSINQWLLFGIGGFVTLLCFVSGLIFTVAAKKEN